ncbi:hypothetical protein BD289DRAFT_18288 [Coniella lustricola]|uniref:Uncharacterized protein n=1 Tax=Coniella lustricola TaxID=2025994 RepID=A0A2T3AJC8_9PEZI|nr:hypothetical protein BD289DRAFT_18288 [Coniella lustricola]
MARGKDPASSSDRRAWAGQVDVECHADGRAEAHYSRRQPQMFVGRVVDCGPASAQSAGRTVSSFHFISVQTRLEAERICLEARPLSWVLDAILALVRPDYRLRQRGVGHRLCAARADAVRSVMRLRPSSVNGSMNGQCEIVGLCNWEGEVWKWKPCRVEWCVGRVACRDFQHRELWMYKYTRLFGRTCPLPGCACSAPSSSFPAQVSIFCTLYPDSLVLACLSFNSAVKVIPSTALLLPSLSTAPFLPPSARL